MSSMSLFRLTLLLHAVSALDVDTSIGPVRGKYERFGNNGVHKFLGLPYAEPPTDKGRFRPPLAKEKSRSVIEAYSTGPVCPQHKDYIKFFNFTHDPDAKFDMSEDCLYMNIWVPSNSEDKLPEKMSVMFYIHSGGWSWGSGNHYDGRWLTMNGNVILVTFNYRLGILGFLRTEDRQIINNGFKDQILAFKWVKQNIAKFGGDPDSITVFGHSAGGASTVYLQAVPELRGMIRRIAPIAGLPGQSWASFSPLERQNLTDHIAEVSGCHQDYLNCLRHKTIEELVDISFKTTISMGMLTAWMPSPDGTIITSYESQLINDGLKNVDLLTSMATSEGTSFASYFNTLYGFEIKEHLSLKEIETMGLLGASYPNSDEILEHVFGRGSLVPVSRGMDFITEAVAWYPMYDLARTHEKNKGRDKKGYALVYDYVPDERRSLFPKPDWQEKSVHGDELPMLFASLLSPVGPAASQKDQETTGLFLTYVTNFVKTGDPNKPVPVNVQWPQFTNDDRLHLYLAKHGFQAERWRFMVKTPEFWDNARAFRVRNHDEL